MSPDIPTLSHGAVTIRSIRPRDARDLDYELAVNRGWLRRWEATNPNGIIGHDSKAGIRSLLSYAKQGSGIPFAILHNGEFAGQLNVSGISYGSLSTATIGYWVSERVAGQNVTPTAVALATDHCMFTLGLHRMEVCIRPENVASLRVVEKLGFRYEGLRRRYIHIDGDWRDHFCFALTVEELPRGVLGRWLDGRVPAGVGSVPEADRLLAQRPLRY